MLTLDKYKTELEEIFKGLNTEEYLIELIPGVINNNYQPQEVIHVLIEHKATKKTENYLFRYGSDLKQFLTAAVNDFEKKIVKEIMNPPSILGGL